MSWARFSIWLGMACIPAVASSTPASPPSVLRADGRLPGDERSPTRASGPINTVPDSTKAAAFETDFVSLDGWQPRTPLGSVVATRRPGTRDGRVVELRYPGDASLHSADRVGPVRWPVELRTREPLHFGEYRVAVEFARCSADEELVNGIFVYANDGADHDLNGIVDNTEIDVEVLCSAPYLYWMTVWTDYQPDRRGARFRKQTRVLDFRNGRYRETPAGKEATYQTAPGGILPEAVDASFPVPGRFYELGFEWRPDFVRYFIRRAEGEIELWKLERREAVPQQEARFMLNVWHSRRHWVGGAEASYPAKDSAMRVDWFRYLPAVPSSRASAE